MPVFIPQKYIPDIEMYLTGRYIGLASMGNYEISNSLFIPMYYAVKILELLGEEDPNVVILPHQLNWAVPKSKEDLKNFGIASLYHLVSGLKSANYAIENEIKDWISDRLKDCMSEDGGFTITPKIYPPYLESTYFGMKLASILGLKLENDFVENTKEFVSMLQNEDGGFRRSLYIGISTLENSYFASKLLW